MEDIEVDYLATVDGAEFLVKVIKKYWERRGLSPNVWVERIGFGSSKEGVAYQVRSDMVNGWPVHG